MLQIDGSYGEGGGQILRTSLSLAAITGQPIAIANIRANRSKPGLAIQHLTAVRAAAAICQAQVKGDAVGSMQLEFIPTCRAIAGSYIFDVAQTTGAGSAGAIMLVLQTILLPLALAKGNSVVTLKGGTHVPWSPPATYIELVYLPILLQMGVQAQMQVKSWGWYPQGNGEVELIISGQSTPLKSLHLVERGNLQAVKGLAVATQLPAHIPQRMVSRAENLLREAKIKTDIQPGKMRGIAPGAGITLVAEYEHSLAGFSALGKLGLAAEKVAEMAVEELLAFDSTGAPVEEHLADQLLLPAALATAASEYRVAEVSTHLTTNAWVIEQFGIAKIAIAPDTKIVTISPTGIS
ncbi:RNA 3'-terminal phosphate cyclase [Aliterella atlantica]|uniref:RNA 3'-terminal phosphate cyclase n=1 Tax=Aliterella atlantica CENA595 TaxID=1618023 RepID=A0A0D8ZNT9_9CYAN|nr:RNA 3'-terminal phosphate cyclase [Aliterella atlantica]KJH70410.1 RNA 3'-phosphate cyclase [Aliterella atlantica CENA595]